MCFVNPCNVCGLCAGGGGGCDGARGGLRTRGGGPATHGAAEHRQGHANEPQPLCAAGTPSSPPPHPLLTHRAAPGLEERLLLGQRSPWDEHLPPTLLGGGRRGLGQCWGWDHPPGFPPSRLPTFPAVGASLPPCHPCPAGPWQAPVAPGWLRCGHRVRNPPQADHPCARCGQPRRRRPHRAPGAGHHPPRPRKPQAGTGGQHHSAPSQAGAPPALPSPSPPPQTSPASGPDGGSRRAGRPGPLPSPSLPQPAQPPRATPAPTPVSPPHAGGAEAEGSSLRQRALPHRTRQGVSCRWHGRRQRPPGSLASPPAYPERLAAPRAKPHCAMVIFSLLGLQFSTNNSDRSPSFSRPRGERRATTTRRGPVRCLMAAGPPRWEGTSIGAGQCPRVHPPPGPTHPC